MCSKSSSSAGPELLPLGRVHGHRGARGELTVRIAGGEAAPWSGARQVWIDEAAGAGGRFYRVESARAYRDRLVLKLEGIEDGNAAASLRGRWVRAEAAEAGSLPPGRYWRPQLVGLEVVDERGRPLGVVEDVVPTAGSDLLSLRTPGGAERLLPLVDQFVIQVDLAGRRIVARPPAEESAEPADSDPS